MSAVASVSNAAGGLSSHAVHGGHHKPPVAGTHKASNTGTQAAQSTQNGQSLTAGKLTATNLVA